MSPADVGIAPDRYDHLLHLLAGWTASGQLPAAALCVGRRGKALPARLQGRQRLNGEAPLRDDALFLVASITKPVVVAGAMMLVEEGCIGLDDRVAEHVPEFGRHGKDGVTLRNLMTHTSGLPDMLPNNAALRASHCPMSRFVSETCQQPLLFPPGTRVRYQSMGMLMLAEVMARVTGRKVAEFLDDRLFRPLGMTDTSLGMRPGDRERVADLRVEAGMEGLDWNWNSDYWLTFGSPWGGLITTPADLARLALCMLGGGTLDGTRVLSQASLQAMTRNQLASFPALPEEDRRCRPWGLGWRLGWTGRSDNYGDIVGPRVFGHWGATGTVLWMEPDTDAFFVLLTNGPQGDEGRYLARASNAFVGCLDP
jgi:CubicO group peptidase (beta-lactamase class C family)